MSFRGRRSPSSLLEDDASNSSSGGDGEGLLDPLPGHMPHTLPATADPFRPPTFLRSSSLLRDIGITNSIDGPVSARAPRVLVPLSRPAAKISQDHPTNKDISGVLGRSKTSQDAGFNVLGSMHKAKPRQLRPLVGSLNTTIPKQPQQTLIRPVLPAVVSDKALTSEAAISPPKAASRKGMRSSKPSHIRSSSTTVVPAEESDNFELTPSKSMRDYNDVNKQAIREKQRQELVEKSNKPLSRMGRLRSMLRKEHPDRRSHSSTQERSKQMKEFQKAMVLFSKGAESAASMLSTGFEKDSTLTNDDRKREDRSLFLFPKDGIIRQRLLQLVESKYFKNFILLLILVNTVFLALWSPIESPDTPKQKVLEKAEKYFVVIFTLEMLVKVIAMGLFMSPGSYLRDSWNVIDFFIVAMGLVSEFLGDAIGNVSSLRVVRLLRPLRTLSTVEGLRVLVQAFLKAIPVLLNAAILLFFVFLMFGLMALQLFKGRLRNQCMNIATGKFDENDYLQRLCGARECPSGYVCLETTINPNFGITNFDSLPAACLNIFQTITLEGWTVTMYRLQDSFNWGIAIYFVSLVVFGSFFVMNLTLAAIKASVNAEASHRKDSDDAELSFKQVKRKKTSSGPHSGLDLTWKKRLEVFVNSELFNRFWMILIILNTLLLSLEHHNMPEDLETFLVYSNYVLAALFFVEMVLKMLGLGIRNYFRVGFNVFDSVIVLVSILEVVVQGLGDEKAAQDFKNVRVFRMFRVLRVAKLIRYVESLQRLIWVISGSLVSIGYISALLALFIFMYAILGVQLFGGKFHFAEGVPRMNFDTLSWAIITVFQMLTEEEWDLVMYNGIRATAWYASLYFVSWMIIGVYFLLNMFLAIVLQNFEEDNQKASQKKRQERMLTTLAGVAGGPTIQEAANENPRSSSVSLLRRESTTTTAATTTISRGMTTRNLREKPGRHIPLWRVLCACRRTNRRPKVQNAPAPIHVIPVHAKKRASAAGFGGAPEAAADAAELRHPGLPDHCCSSSRVYRMLAAIVYDKRFENVIILMIVCSSVALAIESPRLDPQSATAVALFYSDVFFTIAFSIEMVLKITVMGLIGRPDAYLASNWNRLDSFIVVISWVGMISDEGGVSIIKTLRFLRVLRPLRVISRSEGMRVVINALFKTIPSMGNVLIVMFLAWVIFGILAVQLYAGRFYTCSISSDAIVDRDSCIAQGGEWVNSRVNFDNILNAMLSLFEVATLEGWPTIMLLAIDATEVNKVPQPNYDLSAAIFFIVFILLGSFFLISLFVGVVFDNFVQLRDEQSGLAMLTPEQKLWVSTQVQVFRMKPKHRPLPPGHEHRKRLFELVTSSHFDSFIMSCIVLNVCFMGMTFYEEPEYWTLTLEIANYVFGFIFFMEMVLKQIAFGPKTYFRDNWNRFDFLIVLGSLLELVFSLLGRGLGVGLSMGRVLRVFRVSRLLRLVKAAKSLQTLLKTLLVSLPSLVNVGTLLGLMYFLYAVLAVKIFGLVEHGVCLNDHANFETFPNAVLTMFRISTGEDWNCIMHDCMDAEKGGSVFAWAFFVSFVLLVSFITLNLFIAVILDNFSQISSKEDDINRISDDTMYEFNHAWAHFDPQATRFIQSNNLMSLLRRLQPPLGLGRHGTALEMFRLVTKMKIPVHDGNRLHYSEVLFALVHNIVGIDIPTSKLARDLRKKMVKNMPSLGSTDDFLNVDVYLAVVKAQRVWKRKASSRKLAREEESLAALKKQNSSASGGAPDDAVTDNMTAAGAALLSPLPDDDDEVNESVPFVDPAASPQKQTT